MPSRRILIHLAALVGGGAERAIALLASGLVARGHEVVLALDYEAGENAAFVSGEVETIVAGGGHVVSTARLATLMRERDFDIALAALGISNLKLALAATLARSSVSLVMTYHGSFETERGRIGRLSYRLTPWLSRRAARTVAVSDDLKGYLVREFGAAPATTVRIYNPVHLPPPPAIDAAALRARAPVVLAVGRLVPEKGVDRLVRAFAAMRHDARLVLVGDGPEREALQVLAAGLGVADRVDFAGWMPDPGPAYDTAKVLAVPSRTEAFGNVVVEALARGLPVVATDNGGPREILSGGYGTVVPHDDRALAAAIDGMLSDPGDPGPRIARAREFSVDAAVARYEALIEQVLAEP